MTSYSESLATQKPYLMTNQPTIETVKVLQTLYEFFSGSSGQTLDSDVHAWSRSDTFSYQKEIRNCNLDYSINSLKRIDELLLKIRQELPDFTEQRIFTAEYPLHDDSFIKILSYYLGEMISRARREAPVWNSNANQGYIGDQSALAENMFVAFASDSDSHIEDLCDRLVPKQIIYQALIVASDSGILQAQTIWQSVLELVPSTMLDKLDFDDPLLPPPTMALKFDREAAFANLDKADLAYLQMMPPKWMKKDSLYEQMNQLAKLYKTGKVVWAHVVQANKMLWTEEQVYSCPAEILYDPTGRTPVSHLAEVAYELYNLKDTIPDTPDEEILEYAKHITDEFTRVIGFDIPNSISPLPLKSTTMFVWRLHVPNGVLKASFPILISDETPEITILPAKFWSKDYYDEWIENSYFKADMYYSVRKIYESENPWKKNKQHLRPYAIELVDEFPNLANESSYHNMDPKLIDNRFVKVSISQSYADEKKYFKLISLLVVVIIFIATFFLFRYFGYSNLHSK